LKEVKLNGLYLILFILALLMYQLWQRANNFDLAVYGATPAGIISAVTAAEHGARVVLIEPGNSMEGKYSGGLNPADSAVFFESKEAPVFGDLLREAGVKVIKNRYIEEVRRDSSNIKSIHLDSKRGITAKYFIDGSYEGDLMALLKMGSLIVRGTQDPFTREEPVFLGSHFKTRGPAQGLALSDSTAALEGRSLNEVPFPDEMSYCIMTPRQAECKNLLLPARASLSRAAYYGYPLEPGFMQAGLTAGLATILALEKSSSVQEIDVRELKKRLEEEGMSIKGMEFRDFNREQSQAEEDCPDE
jgi:hypothetical protein